MKSRILQALPGHAKWWIQEYGCPILINRYERDYWVSRNHGIRATIDRNLRVYDQRYSGTINTTKRMNISQHVVLEIKGPTGAADAMSELVADLPLPLTRYSKYCAGVDALRGV